MRRKMFATKKELEVKSEMVNGISTPICPVN